MVKLPQKRSAEKAGCGAGASTVKVCEACDAVGDTRTYRSDGSSIILSSDQAYEFLPEFLNLLICQPVDDIKEFCIERFSRLDERNSIITDRRGYARSMVTASERSAPAEISAVLLSQTGRFCPTLSDICPQFRSRIRQ
jgi:hypothetical protein